MYVVCNQFTLLLCRFIGSRAILSGPAGGVVGYAMTTFSKDTKQPVIGFDMGGDHWCTCTRFSRVCSLFCCCVYCLLYM